MAAEKEQFQSIYGDAESEFEIEDVSDETLSISKEEIEEAIAEEPADPVEEPATETEEKDAAKAPAEDNATEESAEETTPAEDAKASAEDTDTAEASDETPAEEPDADEESDETPAHEDDEEPLDGISFEDHHVDADEDEDPDHVYGSHEEDHTDDKVGVISYILHAILFTIPVIGTILMLVYIISDKKNSHLRHFAQIWLITLLIIAIGVYAAVTILGIA